MLDGVFDCIFHISDPIWYLGNSNTIFDSRPIDDAGHASFLQDVTQLGVLLVVVRNYVFRYELVVQLANDLNSFVFSPEDIKSRFS